VLSEHAALASKKREEGGDLTENEDDIIETTNEKISQRSIERSAVKSTLKPVFGGVRRVGNEILKKMEKGLSFLYQDTEHQVGILTDEYKAVKASWKAMKGAQELIEGDTAKEIFEQTCQYVADEIGTKLGEMDRFMEQAHGPLTSMSITNEVFNEQGLEMLAAWEKDGLLSYKAGSLDQARNKVRIDTASNKTDTASNKTDELEAAEMEAAAQQADGNRTSSRTASSSFSKIFNNK
jgi:hypothetical protein